MSSVFFSLSFVFDASDAREGLPWMLFPLGTSSIGCVTQTCSGSIRARMCVAHVASTHVDDVAVAIWLLSSASI